MKKQIKEVQDYFADKLARGLYKTVEADKAYIKVVVDNEYKFALWVKSGETYFSLFSGNFILIEFSDEQKEKGFKNAMRKRDLMWVDETEKKEREQLQKLLAKYPNQAK